MNRAEFERISEKLSNLPGDPDSWVNLVFKCKEIEVLQEISDSLKSVATSLRGGKL